MSDGEARAWGTRACKCAVSVLTDQSLVWDKSDNLIEVFDSRPGEEWPDGFRPASYRASHDALYRVTGAELDYSRDDGSRVPTDDYVDYRDGLSQVRAADPMQPNTAPRVTSTPESRPSSLTYEYDWLANMVESTDDAYQFYERSLGRISNGFEEDNGRPSALRLATDLEHSAPSVALQSGQERGGFLEVGYGQGGNVQTLTVHAQCVDRDFAAAETCHDPPPQTNVPGRLVEALSERFARSVEIAERWQGAERCGLKVRAGKQAPAIQARRAVTSASIGCFAQGHGNRPR